MNQKENVLSDRARDYIAMGITDVEDISPCLRCGESVLPHDLGCQACGDPFPFRMISCRECGMEHKTRQEAANCPCYEENYDEELEEELQRQVREFYILDPSDAIEEEIERAIPRGYMYFNGMLVRDE